MRMLQKMIGNGIVHTVPDAAIDITDIFRWFYEEDKKATYNYLKDFPIVVAPWHTCWMETGPAHYIRRDAAQWPLTVESVGAAIYSISIPEDNAEKALVENWLSETMAVFAPSINAGDQHKGRLDTSMANALPRWISIIQIWITVRRRTMLTGTYGIYVDELGRIINCGDNFMQATIPMAAGQYLDTDERMGDYISGIQPFLFALSLLHCKNVVLEDIDSPAPAVIRKRDKKGIPEIKFKTLVVKPLRQQIRHEQSEDGEAIGEIERALHICRGHFKDFREGNGLFGQLHDLYWWEPFTRGSAKNGVIVKDYKIKAPPDM